MTQERIITRLRDVIQQPMLLPAAGKTPLRHRQLMELGREDLSLARLAEAHFDAVAILAEAGQTAEPGAIYGVWASEIPGHAVRLDAVASGSTMSGTKRFCSGATIVDRALVTSTEPQQQLIDLDLHKHASSVTFDYAAWKPEAFRATKTASATFHAVPVSANNFVGSSGWYLSRPGFWHGACGPAACWAGGALGLVDWAKQQHRDDPHTLAHVGAMEAAAWSLAATLDVAGREIDAAPKDIATAHRRALTVRHLVEQASTDILRRLTRAFGPHPLALDAEISRRYAELDMYLRQSHAERDLEVLGRAARGLL